MPHRAWLSFYLLGLAGCGAAPAASPDASVDAGTRFDAGSDDANVSQPDGGAPSDSGALSDSGPADAGAADAGPPPPTGPPGGLDDTFGTGGILDGLGLPGTRDIASAVVVQPDQRILVGGYVTVGTDDELYVMRLMPDGTRDPSFATDGIFQINANPGGSEQVSGLALTSGGNIVVGSDAHDDLAVLELDSNGAVLTSFGTAGWTYVDGAGNDRLEAVLVDDADRIYVIGGTSADAVVARLDASGHLDGAYHGGAPLILDFGGTDDAVAGALQSDGALVIGGGIYAGTAQGFLSRISAAGELETGFGTGGSVLIPTVSVEAVAMRGTSIFVAGDDPTTYALSLYDSRGRLDTRFATGGVSELSHTSSLGQMYAALAHPNGHVYAAGANGDFVVGAWLGNGATDVAFGPGGSVVTIVSPDPDYPFAMALTPDGRLVVVGDSVGSTETHSVVVRYFP